MQWVRRGSGPRPRLTATATSLIGVRREVVGRCEDGSTFAIDLVISEIKIEDRRTFTLIGRNLSERRALEKEVLEASAREQQRISRDLHDRVGQELTGIGYLATSLSQELGAHPAGAAATKIAEGIQRVVGEVRSAIRGLTPVAIEDNGLTTALEELAARTQEHFAIALPLRLQPGGPDPRQPDCHAPLLHCAGGRSQRGQARHGPRRSWSRSEARCKAVTLEISDDGVGIAPHAELGPEDGPAHHALSGRRDRRDAHDRQQSTAPARA